MSIKDNLHRINSSLPPDVKLVAVSKTYGSDKIMEAYNAGQRIFGENKVQEMIGKYEQLPKDIEWHLIGHLQTNKVKYIAPFVSLIHSVDSLKLLIEIDKQAKKNNRVVSCLLQVHIASEETKYGLYLNEIQSIIESNEAKSLNNIRIIGLMGMASNVSDKKQIALEFKTLKDEFLKYPDFTVLCMGMSSDYLIAIENGSTMIRVGTAIFGERNYSEG
ncbi:MAG: YggS family pyridoxal phosphate-dependent enzyme [Bacteroidia bacterium]|jgi:pyridoxal phosphate enzyme (YggS family)